MTRNRGLTIAASVAITLTLLLATVGSAAAKTQFGANFNPNTQPSNGAPAHHCKPDDAATCTWVMNFAFAGAGTSQLPLRAPKDGTIGKIKILSATSGSFRLLLARTKSNPTRSKVVRRGPSLSYNGNGGAGCTPNCTIESFSVSLTVKKGDILAFRAGQAGFLRCNSGSPNILFYQPPLPIGGSFQQPDDDDGCFVLMKAVYK
jgi:hypothetical protein